MSGQLPDGLIAFGPNANCTLDLCPLSASILQYRPSVPANSLFIGVFSVALIIHALQGWRGRTWGFMACMIGGCILEIIGYIGRLMLYNNPFSYTGFLIQIICITVAPVFFCSAVYVLLSQVYGFPMPSVSILPVISESRLTSLTDRINHIDKSISRFEPRLLYCIFIPSDIVSLVLQAFGGAWSSEGKTHSDVQVGVDVSLAGLSFQVFTLAVFCALFVDYLIACERSPSARKCLTTRMKTFLGFMFLGIFLILIRCAYRIVELKNGYFSSMFRDETLFIALESAVMCVAAFSLNLGHPAIGFGGKSKGMHSATDEK